MFKQNPFLSLFGVLVIVGFLTYGIVHFLEDVTQGRRGRIVNHPDPVKPLDIPAGIHNRENVYPSKEYTQTIGGLTTTIKLGSDTMNMRDGKGYMLVTLKGDQISKQYEKERLPLNLALVIDRSGSMSGEKLENVKRSLINIASMLDERDHVSLTIYDNEVETIYDSNFEQETFMVRVNGITSRGSTNIEGGLRQGIQKVQGFSFIQDNNRINRVILLSDGLANVGIQTPAGLAGIVEELAEKNVTVSTIGVGSDYDENIMTQVALAGNGNYYFLAQPTDSEEIFAKEFNSMVNTIAKDIHVNLGVDGRFKVTRAIGYKMTNNNSFDPKNVYAGREVSYLFEIQGNNLEYFSTNVTKIANVSIVFHSVMNGRKEEMNIQIPVHLTNKNINPLADDRVYKEFMDSIIAERLWDVDSHLDQVQNHKAKTVVDQLLQEVKSANQRMNGAYDSDISNLEQRRQYIDNQGVRDIKEDAAGRNMKKSIQSESFDKQYNK